MKSIGLLTFVLCTGGVAWGQDPQLIARYNGVSDPTTEGFLLSNDAAPNATSSSVEISGFYNWSMTAPGSTTQTFYKTGPINSQQLADAVAYGWVADSILHLVSGAAGFRAEIRVDTGTRRFDAGLGLDASSNLMAYVVNTGGAMQTYSLSGSISTQHEVGMKYDAASQTATLYVDAVPCITGYVGRTDSASGAGLEFGIMGNTGTADFMTALLFRVYEMSVILSGEAPGRLITNLVAGGFGNVNIYEAVLLLKDNSSPSLIPVIPAYFTYTLQGFCPTGANSGIFTNQLKNYVGQTIAVGYDCTVQPVAYQSSLFTGQSGVSKLVSTLSGFGSTSWLYATNLANPLTSWTTTAGSVTTPYRATTLGYIPGPASTVPTVPTLRMPGVWLLGCGLGVAAVYLMRRRLGPSPHSLQASR